MPQSPLHSPQSLTPRIRTPTIELISPVGATEEGQALDPAEPGETSSDSTVTIEIRDSPTPDLGRESPYFRWPRSVFNRVIERQQEEDSDISAPTYSTFDSPDLDAVDTSEGTLQERADRLIAQIRLLQGNTADEDPAPISAVSSPSCAVPRQWRIKCYYRAARWPAVPLLCRHPDANTKPQYSANSGSFRISPARWRPIWTTRKYPVSSHPVFSTALRAVANTEFTGHDPSLCVDAQPSTNAAAPTASGLALPVAGATADANSVTVQSYLLERFAAEYANLRLWRERPYGSAYNHCLTERVILSICSSLNIGLMGRTHTPAQIGGLTFHLDDVVSAAGINIQTSGVRAAPRVLGLHAG
ncbi:hypothetical protein C8J57DRAFT_1230045 [Mycena rebaudengoi]|nr:hypothetical protein C8J57DRAFT_1230045 [Mycena rebaudengoi]